MTNEDAQQVAREAVKMAYPPGDAPPWVRQVLRALRRALLAFCSDIEGLCKNKEHT